MTARIYFSQSYFFGISSILLGRQTSGTSPKSATSPAKRGRTEQLACGTATSDSGIWNEADPRTAARQKWRRIDITSWPSLNYVSHTEMNETICCPQRLTSPYDQSRLHSGVTYETTDRHHHIGTETRFWIWVNRHELLANHHSGERDVSRHWCNDLATLGLLKVNRSVPGAKFARRFNVRICHCPMNGRNQTIGGNEKGKKNHQSLCAITIALR